MNSDTFFNGRRSLQSQFPTESATNIIPPIGHMLSASDLLALGPFSFYASDRIFLTAGAAACPRNCGMGVHTIDVLSSESSEKVQTSNRFADPLK
jgi:hypothetical protein